MVVIVCVCPENHNPASSLSESPYKEIHCANRCRAEKSSIYPNIQGLNINNKTIIKTHIQHVLKESLLNNPIAKSLETYPLYVIIITCM